MGQRYFEPRGSKNAETEARATFHVVSHEILFTDEKSDAAHCHACEEGMDEEDDDRFAVHGRGLLLFSRGEERRAEEPQLCSSCGAAIGMAMLTRWQIEEEEG